MKKDFVTYDIAVKLRKKGFNIDTDFCYNQDGGIVRVGTCPAPQIHEVFDWLRGKKGIHVSPSVYGNEFGRKWNYAIINIENGELLNKELGDNYERFYDASIAGIEYVVDKII